MKRVKGFKKGDLVLVYGNVGTGCGMKKLPQRWADYYVSDGAVGKVVGSWCPTEMHVRITARESVIGGYVVTVHPKQCRHFKPKAAK